MLPWAWDMHFLGALQDPIMANWKVFLYMDSLVNNPFAPNPGSPLQYHSGAALLGRRTCDLVSNSAM